MLKLFTTKQAQELDAYTINNEPISSIDLMERAAKAFVRTFMDRFSDTSQSIAIYAGTGNNGGDGLSIARLLFQNGYSHISIKTARFSDKSTSDFHINLNRLRDIPIPITDLHDDKAFPEEKATILIDALLGSGLTRPLSDAYAQLVHYLNKLRKTVVAVDIPTGFFAEGIIAADAVILKTDLAICFQRIPVNFLLPDTAQYVRSWVRVDIGLDKSFIQSLDSPYFLVEEQDINKILIRLRRSSFQSKWDFGHALVVAGQSQTMGAALLCADACLHTGAGLTTACIPFEGLTALNAYAPEVMAMTRSINDLSKITWKKFTAIAVGPGLGQDVAMLHLLKFIIENYKKPIVLDADALNLLATNPHIWHFVPENSILTPHVKEFDRLFGQHNSWSERLLTMQQEASQKKWIILLKNRYTIIATPNRNLFFNPTGNPAMATGGMGDVLTGIIVGLLAQGYQAEEAALVGAYIHGKCGDDLAFSGNFPTITPRAVVHQIGVTMAKLSLG